MPWTVFFTLFQRAREGRKKDTERFLILLQLNQKVYMLTVHTIKLVSKIITFEKE